MITPQELAGRYFNEYRTQGNELITKHCPFCQGGEHRDKETALF